MNTRYPDGQSVFACLALPGHALGRSLLCAALGLATPMLAAQPVAAPSLGTAVQTFAIPPGPLQAVLSQFAGEAGVNLFADPALTENRQSAGLKGEFGIAEGFAKLLQGTGLEVRATGQGRYALRRSPGMAGGVTELESVEVLGQNNPKDAMYQAAGSMNVLTRDDIERFRGTSVGDIFQGIPGVLVGENRNSGGLDINIRGMQGQGRVPVLVDGARQETTVYRGYAGVSSRSYVDPDLIGGITIEKGPTMAAGGTGATGGLVSMRTLNAEDILEEGETFGVRMRGSAIGNNSGSVPEAGTQAGYYFPLGAVYRKDCVIASTCGGEYQMPDSFAPEDSMDRPGTFTPKSWAGSLAIAQRFEKIDLIAAYAQRSQGNYYAGKHGSTPTLSLDERKYAFYTEVRPSWEGASRFRGEERIVNSNYESKSLLLKSRIALSESQQLDLSFLRYRSVYGELMPSQLVWYGAIRQTDNSEVHANTYTAKYRWDPADNDALDLNVNLWHTDTKSANANYSQDATGLGDFSSTAGTEQYKRWGSDISNTSRWQSAWGDLELSYGLAGQRESVQFLDGEGRNGNRKELSLFTSLQWHMTDSLLLEAGLRHSRFSVHDNQATIPGAESAECVDADGDGSCDPIKKSNHHSGTTPLASLRWEPLDGLQLYVRYAEAMRMPSLFESTSGFSATPALDASLQPEHTRNREIGLNYSHDGWLASHDSLRLKFAYFRNHTKNYLTRTIPNLWEDEASGRVFFTMRNVDSVSFKGMELSGAYDIGWLFTELGGTRYTGIEVCHTGSYRREACNNYGIQDSYVNNMIPPNWHASAVLGTRLLNRKLELGVRGTFMGQRNKAPEYNDATANGLLQIVPWQQYKVFDFFASYRVNRALSLDFNLDNFTDRYYLDALSLGLVPAPGRTARLSATLQF
ncbi:TonB-dependent receptor [Kerstersia gyiorum]|uniref:TonB-dependent receptor n=1 Tax=Kerstersia gyiorum TaxID=206506 RepID=UPI00214FF9F5|nr:TonB-dependent receptor [Kerstersia gyiorum]MCR4157912.1 TonB-dependent receptor [Kerstersia gyiorum]